jgi:hypothetical protein
MASKSLAKMKGFSLSHVNALRAKMARLHGATAKIRAKAGETMETLVRTGEISATSFALGVVHTRFADANNAPPMVMGVPVELLAGVAAHGLAFMGIGRGMESHLKAVGDASLGMYFATLGRGVGKQLKSGQPLLDGFKSRNLIAGDDALTADAYNRLAQTF